MLRSLLRRQVGLGFQRAQVHAFIPSYESGAAYVFVIVRTVFVDRVVLVPGQIRPDKPREVYPNPASVQIIPIVVLDEITHR